MKAVYEVGRVRGAGPPPTPLSRFFLGGGSRFRVGQEMQPRESGGLRGILVGVAQELNNGEHTQAFMLI